MQYLNNKSDIQACAVQLTDHLKTPLSLSPDPKASQAKIASIGGTHDSFAVANAALAAGFGSW
jgi:hypothetical protein